VYIYEYARAPVLGLCFFVSVNIHLCSHANNKYVAALEEDTLHALLAKHDRHL